MTYPDMTQPPFEPEKGSPEILSVSQVTSQIKALLDASFPFVWVEGEVSNFKHHTSGHMYLTLKDDRAELRSVMFRRDNQFLRFTPEDGMKVLAQGNITVYESRGVYQLVVRRMEPAGLGTLYLAFEALKKKLTEEGLFDERRKQPLPRYPFRVGVVTSSTGAAIQDIRNVLGRRAPHVELVLRPTVVQGAGAADDIVEALKDFEDYGKADVLIVGRGGGSLEDLWPFNEEKVARAMAACPIPIVSAVGHESDFTIADFVADLRAATPSAAAELVAPSREDLLSFLDGMRRRVVDSLNARIERGWQTLDTLTARYGFQQPARLVENMGQRVNDSTDRMVHRIRAVWDLKRARFQGLQERLLAVSPRSILERGYSIVYTLPDRRVVSRVGLLEVGETFGVQMSDGWIRAETREVSQDDPWAPDENNGEE
ncbi:MAG: exodeoxyribonuclease VII large subunit [Fidelibacterota bacterium]